MKNLVTISLFIFFGAILVLSVANIFSGTKIGQKTASLPGLGNNANLSSGASSIPNAKSSGAKSYTLADIVQHNNGSDCWLVIDSKVYDVTNYIPSHPGGPDMITQLCVEDATRAFTIDFPHSQRADNILKSYYIGDLK